MPFFFQQRENDINVFVLHCKNSKSKCGTFIIFHLIRKSFSLFICFALQKQENPISLLAHFKIASRWSCYALHIAQHVNIYYSTNIHRFSTLHRFSFVWWRRCLSDRFHILILRFASKFNMLEDAKADRKHVLRISIWFCVKFKIQKHSLHIIVCRWCLPSMRRISLWRMHQ